MDKIGVIGIGYVGLIQGIGLAEQGWNVMCTDCDLEKIALLQSKKAPIYEKGIQELLKHNAEIGRIKVANSIREVISSCRIIFITVGTPSSEDGSSDIHHVLEVAKTIGMNMNDYKIIINKSTVPVGTARLIKNIVLKELKARDVRCAFDVISNPEFLREGQALWDWFNPDRIVIGSDSLTAIKELKKVYDNFLCRGIPCFTTDNFETAELIKYASNAFLAVKISYINEMALLADQVGADIHDIAEGMGLDHRISSAFLKAGPGYGGSCFPKDTRALINIANKNAVELCIVKAAIQANKKQKLKIIQEVKDIVSNSASEEYNIVTVLGLTFKEGTDDVRESPSLDIIRGLVAENFRIKAYCPKGMENAKKYLEDINIIYSSNEYEACEQSRAVLLLTAWKQFDNINWEKVRGVMKDNYFFDYRNAFTDDLNIRKMFKYSGMGRN